MNFAAMVLSAGVAGALLAYNLQGPAIAAGDSLTAAMRPSVEITGSVQPDLRTAPTSAMRMIDLRSGKVCKLARPDTSDTHLKRLPIGPDCASPYLERVAYWRSTEDGALIMADRRGETVLEFAPADGALYESVFPANEIITIVPARG